MSDETIEGAATETPGPPETRTPDAGASATQKTKTRKPRKPSKFVVLQGHVCESDPTLTEYTIEAEAKSIDGCRNQIKEKKITGDLLIACVHRSLTVKMETVQTLTGI